MNYRNRKLLDLSYNFTCMIRLPCCEGTIGEPAHSNQAIHGKGGAMKAHDCFHLPGCRACHRELDQGRTMDREMKFSVWNRGFGLYLPMLFDERLVVVR